MPVPALKRRLEIAQLVRKLIQRVEGLAPASAVFDLANSLASLMNEMQGEGIAPNVIEGLDISDFSGHWERALQFITIVQRYFEGGEAPEKRPGNGPVFLPSPNVGKKIHQIIRS